MASAGPEHSAQLWASSPINKQAFVMLFSRASRATLWHPAGAWKPAAKLREPQQSKCQNGDSQLTSFSCWTSCYYSSSQWPGLRSRDPTFIPLMLPFTPVIPPLSQWFYPGILTFLVAQVWSSRILLGLTSLNISRNISCWVRKGTAVWPFRMRKKIWSNRLRTSLCIVASICSPGWPGIWYCKPSWSALKLCLPLCWD